MNDVLSLNEKVVAVIGAMLIGACGGAELDRHEYTEAESAVTAARVSGAEHEPNAALHLQLAREQIVRAQQLIESGDEDEANRMLDRAQVDAELAMALAVAQEQRTEALDAQHRVEQLRQGNALDMGGMR